MEAKADFNALKNQWDGIEKDFHTWSKEVRKWVGGWCGLSLCESRLSLCRPRSSSLSFKPSTHPSTHPLLPKKQVAPIDWAKYSKAIEAPGFVDFLKQVSPFTHPPTHTPTHFPALSIHPPTHRCIANSSSF